MRNHYSSKEEAAQELWKEERAVLGLPVNTNLVPGRVLCKRSDGYYDVGTVHSLSEPGSDRDWLKEALRLPPGNKCLPPLVVSDDDGAFAKLLVGPVNAAAWFQEFESVQVHVPECQVRELDIKDWDEMMDHFDPGLLHEGRELELFIVQKVLLVSQIKITASYGRGLECTSTAEPFQNVNIEASFRTTSSNIVGEFALSAAGKKKKLPVAFSGFSYRYDKFGVREAVGKATGLEADGEVGESSGASDEDDDDPGDDPDLRPLMEFNEGWYAEAKHTKLEFFEHVEEEEEEEQEDEDEDEDEVVDPNASGMEDID